jgi:hypothetical protein
VRATLKLNQTCPTAEAQAELDGTITWSAFGSADAENGIQFGDQLAATFAGDVVDRRTISLGTPPAAGGHLEGSFDFIVRQGKAAQAY